MLRTRKIISRSVSFDSEKEEEEEWELKKMEAVLKADGELEKYRSELDDKREEVRLMKEARDTVDEFEEREKEEERETVKVDLDSDDDTDGPGWNEDSDKEDEKYN